VIDDCGSTGTHVVDDAATCKHRYTIWWMMWRAMVHYAVRDVAGIGNYVVDDGASIGTSCGG